MADRRVRIPPDRVMPWLANFAARHGEPVVSAVEDGLAAAAPDGAEAVLLAPFPPWRPSAAESGNLGASLAAHAVRERRVGLLLARKGAHAVGIAAGERLVASSVDRHYVQGRTKAGGWSQQRYARRRANQARAAFDAAADDAATLLLPSLETLDYLVTGGEQRAVDAVLADPRLAPLAEVLTRWPRPALPTPEPRQAVLEEFARTAREVEIVLNDRA